MPRWKPIPAVLSHEQATDEATEPPAKEPKTNGYIFKDRVDGSYRETRYVARVCRAGLPAYPRTYGLRCERQDCQHCHPTTAAEMPHMYTRPRTWWIHHLSRRYYYGAYYAPRPGSCLTGKRGCQFHKMIKIRPAKKDQDVVAKDETRRRAARAEQAVEEKQDEKSHEKSQRLSKWETSTSRHIDEGSEMALSEEVVLPADDWTRETEDIQLAILASLGLLDDYEAEDADITLNSLSRNEDLYTIRYKPGRNKMNIRGSPWEAEVPVLDDDVDWELVIGSQSEGSMSWTMLDE